MTSLSQQHCVTDLQVLFDHTKTHQRLVFGAEREDGQGNVSNFQNSDSHQFRIHRFEELSSTNSFLKQKTGEYEDFSVIWADRQPSGRGRFDRRWQCVPGKDLAFSVKIPLRSIPVSLWPSVTLVTGLSIARTINATGIASRIKWPNDILIGDRKVCGILCESICGTESHVIAGIGLNVNSTREELGLIDQPATSLSVEAGHEIDRSSLLSSIVSSIITNISILADSGFEPFRTPLTQLLAWKDKQVLFSEGNGSVHNGFIKGVQENGALLLLREDGSESTMYAGELVFRR